MVRDIHEPAGWHPEYQNLEHFPRLVVDSQVGRPGARYCHPSHWYTRP